MRPRGRGRQGIENKNHRKSMRGACAINAGELTDIHAGPLRANKLCQAVSEGGCFAREAIVYG